MFDFLKKNDTQTKYAKGSFEHNNRCVLVAFKYNSEHQLLTYINKMKKLGFVYDGVYSPLRETKEFANHANYCADCIKEKVTAMN